MGLRLKENSREAREGVKCAKISDVFSALKFLFAGGC